MNFSEFNLSEQTKRAVSELGFTEATDIQERSIPLILEGKDIIGFSQTGSGKTAAYGLPVLEQIDTELNARHPQILVLCPTRELAMQVTDELHKFSKYTERIRIVPVYGGQPINRQVALVKSGCQIIVGTPGRIMDLLGRKVLDFDFVRTVILDEADEMLDMGFREDIEAILEKTPTDRQTLLFSATMPRAIIEITGKYQKDPEMVQIKSAQMTADNIEQSFFEVARGCKKDALALLLQYYMPVRSLVFCNTKRMVDEVTEDLKKRGFSTEGLHGDMKQEERTRVMNRFKSGGFEILVATDVAARGIDVNNIDIVFNYDLPDNCEYYIHRIGRTARGGKTGASFTIIQNSEQYGTLRGIAAHTKSEIVKKELPTVKEIKKKQASLLVDEIKTFIQENDCSDCEEQLDALLSSDMDERNIALGLIKMYLKERSLKKGTSDVPKAIIREAPAPKRRERTRERTPNDRARKKFENVDMEKITISIGRNDKVAPKHILGAVAGESGLPGNIMGTIDIRNTYTTIDVPKEYKGRIIKSLNKKSIKGKTVSVK